MFQSRAQEPHVVYLCYERWLFCISHPYSCSTNIINQERKASRIDSPVVQQQKKSLNHFLKRFGLNGLYHCVTKWLRHAILVIHGPDRLAALPTIQGMFLFTFQAWMVPVPTLHRDLQAHLINCSQYITVKNKTAHVKIYRTNCKEIEKAQMKKD